MRALIDTGADYRELPNCVAQQLGINLNGYQTTTRCIVGDSEKGSARIPSAVLVP